MHHANAGRDRNTGGKRRSRRQQENGFPGRAGSFDPQQHAFYYARALEIPTPRWSTYDAVRNNLPLLKDVPATIQERAWTSPIWYKP